MDVAVDGTSFALPPPTPAPAPADRPRAVEDSAPAQHNDLESSTGFGHSAAVLQVVRGVADSFDDLVAQPPLPDPRSADASRTSVGSLVDVRA